MTTVFDNETLLPRAWSSELAAGPARCFNPALLRDGDGWIFAYRVVIEPALDRRIAICRLDAGLQIVPGSQMPLSDQIRFASPNDYAAQALTWFADPRLYRLAGRLFLYWNSGWHEPRNHQFLQELDPATLRPIGVARELTLAGPRQPLEKNWALFECDGVHAVYSVNPHRVLSVSLGGTGPVVCEDLGAPQPNPGGYAQVHGGLRGGAPPQRIGDRFFSVCHSIENLPSGYGYVAGVYRFEAARPFRPTAMPKQPLPLEVPAAARRALPKLNPAIAEVIYPAGAVIHEDRWFISFGVDDERCAIGVLPHETVLATLGD